MKERYPRGKREISLKQSKQITFTKKNPTQIDTPLSQSSEDSTTIHHAESLRGITDLSNPINTKDQHSQWD